MAFLTRISLQGLSGLLPSARKIDLLAGLFITWSFGFLASLSYNSTGTPETSSA